MKKTLKGFVTGVIVTALLLSTVTVFAFATRTIEINVGGYRVFVPVELLYQDSGGTAREPPDWDASNGYLHFDAVTEGYEKIHDIVQTKT